jgi:RNA polymerase sigma-70 factor, ECF subfamily
MVKWNHDKDCPNTLWQSHSLNASPASRMAMSVKLGDRDAAQWIYLRFRSRVTALMKKMVGEQDADDLTQHCFLVMLSRIDRFGGKSSFWTWFYRLAVNEALQYLRKKRRRPTFCLPAEEIGVLTPLPNKEDVDAFCDAIDELTSIERQTLTLHYRDGLSYKSISERLHIPLGTVGSRIHQAKKRLLASIRKASQGTI